MKKYIFFILLCFLPLCQAQAAAIKCTYTSLGELDKEASLPAANVTLSGNIADYTILYSFPRIMLGITQASCTGTPTSSGINITLTDMPPGNALSYGGYIIYPTSISGIGISIRNYDYTNINSPVPIYPITLFKYPGFRAGIGGWVEIKLWKIPGAIGTGNNGVLNFTGPTLQQGFQLDAADSFTADTDMSYSPAGSTKYFTVTSRKITGSATFTNGTCQLSTGEKTVEMGKYDAGRGSQSAGAWVDASFALKCPTAAGYGGSNNGGAYQSNSSVLTGGTVAANTIKNANLTITIVPMTPVITQNDTGVAVRGAIGLDGTGAKGYGVQLAWGDAGALGTGQPAKPVEFNTPVLASQISSLFTSGAYNIGQAMPTSAIKMAARFIRVKNETEPGDAKASIEVIANYN